MQTSKSCIINEQPKPASNLELELELEWKPPQVHVHLGGARDRPAEGLFALARLAAALMDKREERKQKRLAAVVSGPGKLPAALEASGERRH